VILKHSDPQGAIHVPALGNGMNLGPLVEPGEPLEVTGQLAEDLLKSPVWERVDKPARRAKEPSDTGAGDPAVDESE
jgi:hypothetical protein